MNRYLQLGALSGRRLLSSQAAPAGSSSNLFVVFGASKENIGGALADRLLKHHDGHVVVAGRNEDKLSALKHALGDRCEYHIVDALNSAEVDSFLKHLKEPITGVANCIGTVILKPAHSTTEKEFEDTMRINAFSSFNILKSSVKLMSKQQHGSIAFCASAVAMHGIQNHEAIAAAKGAIVSMAKSAASTYAPKNIRINCVAPGLIATPMTDRITSNDAARKASESMHALKRIGKPQDVAAALEFFLNPENTFITGQVLGVDGGLGSVRAQ